MTSSERIIEVHNEHTAEIRRYRLSLNIITAHRKYGIQGEVATRHHAEEAALRLYAHHLAELAAEAEERKDEHPPYIYPEIIDYEILSAELLSETIISDIPSDAMFFDQEDQRPGQKENRRD